MISTAKNYRKYDPSIKLEVARTGNVYLFPELKIPRTTAQYWVQNCNIKSFSTSIEDIDSIYKTKSEFLEQELKKERALRTLIEKVRKIFPKDFASTYVKSKTSRIQIVEAIKDCSQLHKISVCLNSIGLSKSSYQRWASEVSFCKSSKLRCQRQSPFQLTQIEISTMKNFVTSKKYSHISIASLHLLAQRTKALFCSVETWYKYVRYYGWERPDKVLKKEFKKTGVRASKPNEIWHVDVTVVNLRPGKKLYIQAVIDNFSRYVLAWRVSESINAIGTVEVLKLAKSNAKEIALQTTVLTDPGTENNNMAVARYVNSVNMNRVLARVDVQYSNSMIESLFRMLKNNFLYHQNIRNIDDLIRKANFYFNQHNNIIPRAIHKGATPKEYYRSEWSELNHQDLKQQMVSALAARKKVNLQPSCGNCH